MHNNLRGNQTCQWQEQAVPQQGRSVLSAAAFLSQQIHWEPSTASPPGSPSCTGLLLTCRRIEREVHTPARGIHLRGSCLLSQTLRSSLCGHSAGEELGMARDLGHGQGSISNNLIVNQLDELSHSHFLASTSAPKHLSSYSPFLLFPHRVWNGAGYHLEPRWGGVECVAILQSFSNLDPDYRVLPYWYLSLSLLSDHSQGPFQGAKWSQSASDSAPK